jgi:hypothetical protein
MCAVARTSHRETSSAYSAFRANPAAAGPTESMTLCDGRHGTDVWLEFRERPRPADLSAADGRAPGRRQERGRSLADTYNFGGWFTAAGGRWPSEGPVPDVRPEGSGQRPRRSGSLEAIRAAMAAWLCDVPLQGGEPWPGCAAAAPGSGPCTRCTTIPGRPAGLRRLRGPGRVDPGTHRGGFRAVRPPRPGSMARRWRCWPGCAAHRTPRSARIPA